MSTHKDLAMSIWIPFGTGPNSGPGPHVGLWPKTFRITSPKLFPHCKHKIDTRCLFRSACVRSLVSVGYLIIDQQVLATVGMALDPDPVLLEVAISSVIPERKPNTCFLKMPPRPQSCFSRCLLPSPNEFFEIDD